MLPLLPCEKDVTQWDEEKPRMTYSDVTLRLLPSHHQGYTKVSDNPYGGSTGMAGDRGRETNPIIS